MTLGFNADAFNAAAFNASKIDALAASAVSSAVATASLTDTPAVVVVNNSPLINALFGATSLTNPISFSNSTGGYSLDGSTRFGVNLLPYSEAFNLWAAGSGGATVALNAISGPLLGANAASVTNNSSGADTTIYYKAPVVTGVNYVFSLYAKAGNTNRICIFQQQNSGYFTTNNVFDFTTGTFTSVDTNTVASGAASLGGGWFRIWVAITSAQTESFSEHGAFCAVGNTATGLFGGSAGQYVYAFGAQSEVGTTPTAYGYTNGTTYTSAPRITSAGLLVEPSSTNWFWPSQTPPLGTSADRAGGATVAAASITAPDGTSTAQTITSATSYGFHGMGLTVPTAGVTTITGSFYFKSNTNPFLKFRLNANDGNSCQAYFDTSGANATTFYNTGTITNNSFQLISLPNGWYRAILTCTWPNATTGPAIVVGFCNGFGNDYYVGSASDKITVWGFQYEFGTTTATSLIPTTTAAVTRAADVAQLTTSASTNPFPNPLLSYLSASPLGAYGLRLLKTGYAGYCLRVRRSSDNATQDIGFVGGVLDTASLLAFCGTSRGLVTIWYDQSGNGYDLNAGNGVGICNNGVVYSQNGVPMLDPSTNPGSYEYLHTTAAPITASAQPWTLAMFAGGTSAGGYQQLCNVGPFYIEELPAGAIGGGSASNDIYGNEALMSNGSAVVCRTAETGGGTEDLAVDFAPTKSQTLGGSIGAGSVFQVGRNAVNPTERYNSFFVFGSVISDADSAKLRAWMLWTNNLSARIPASSPYAGTVTSTAITTDGMGTLTYPAGGVRNLLGSSDPWTWGGNHATKVATVKFPTGYVGYLNWSTGSQYTSVGPESCPPGVYTISFWAWTDSGTNTTISTYLTNNNDWADTSPAFTITSTPTRFTRTVTFPSGTVGGSFNELDLIGGPAQIYIACVQLEAGASANGFSPTFGGGATLAPPFTFGGQGSSFLNNQNIQKVDVISLGSNLYLDFTKSLYLQGRTLANPSFSGLSQSNTSLVYSADGKIAYGVNYCPNSNASLAVSHGTCTYNAASAPDGSKTAQLFVADGTANVHSIGVYTFNSPTSTTVTGSAYVKRGSTNFFELDIRDANNSAEAYASFDFSGANTTTTTVASGASNASASLISVGNGWYRATLTATFPATFVYGGISVIPCDTFAGGYNSSTASIYTWGFQVENGTAATPYAPTTGTNVSAPRITSAGLLVEASATNILPYSNNVGGGGGFLWAAAAGTCTPNAATAPDGTNTAGLYVPSTSSAVQAEYYNGITTVSGTTYTFSTYIKASGYSLVCFSFGDSGTFNGFWGTVNLATGVITASGGTGAGSYIAGTVTALSGGWFRVAITGVAGNTTAYPTYNVVGTTAGTYASTFVGDGTSGILLWGAQVEAATAASSLIVTGTGTATRAADTALETYTGSASKVAITTSGLGAMNYPATNLFPNSQGGPSMWTYGAVPMTANQLAPDGTLTATLVSPTSTFNQAAYGVNYTAGLTYTASVWLWVPSGSGKVRMIMWPGSGSNLESPDLILTTKPQRFTFTSSVPFSTTNGTFELESASDGTFQPFYYWGIQVEQSTSANGYVPTSGASATITPTSPFNLAQAPFLNGYISSAVVTASTGTADLLAAAISEASVATGTLAHGTPLASAAQSSAVSNGAIVDSIPLAGSAQATSVTVAGAIINYVLASSVQSSAVSTGGISVNFKIASNAVSTTNSSGAILDNIPLSAAVASTAVTAGLTTDATPLNAAASAASVTSATIAHTVTLAASVAATSIVTPNLTDIVTDALSTTVSASAVATGAITDSIPLTALASETSSTAAAMANTINLAGSGAEASVTTSALTTAKPLSVSAPAVSISAGSLTDSTPLSGLASSVSIMSGSTADTVPLIGVGSSVSFGSGLTTDSTPLSGSASSLSATAGLTTDAVPVASGAQSVSTGLGGLQLGKPINAPAQATSVATGAIIDQIPLASAVQATTVATSNISNAISLAATAVVTTTEVSQVSNTPTDYLASAASSTTTATGTIAYTNLVAASVTSSTSSTGAITDTIPLSGTAVETSAVTPGTSVAKPLAAAAAITSLAQASPNGVIPVSASVSATTTATGALTNTETLSGTASATTIVTPSMTDSIPLSGTAQATTLVVAQNTDLIGLASSVSATTSSSASDSVNYQVTSSAQVTSTTLAALTRVPNESASISTSSVATGSVSLQVSLSGSATAQTSVTPSLTDTSNYLISGSAVVTTTTVAAINDTKYLSDVTAQSVSTATGTLSYALSLAAAAASSSVTSAQLGVNKALTSTALSTSFSAGNIVVAYQLAAAVQVQTSSSGFTTDTLPLAMQTFMNTLSVANATDMIPLGASVLSVSAMAGDTKNTLPLLGVVVSSVQAFGDTSDTLPLNGSIITGSIGIGSAHQDVNLISASNFVEDTEVTANIVLRIPLGGISYSDSESVVSINIDPTRRYAAFFAVL